MALQRVVFLTQTVKLAFQSTYLGSTVNEVKLRRTNRDIFYGKQETVDGSHGQHGIGSGFFDV